MHTHRPTVVIVGAGPAGAAAARVAASQGLRTLLLERSRHPRRKVCGEGCTPRAVHTLQRLGLLEKLGTEASEVHQAFLVSPGGIELLSDLPSSIYGGKALIVPRSTLDSALVEQAVAAGAELREQCQVERVQIQPDRALVYCKDKEPLSADFVIGCDGMPSVVRKTVGAQAFAPHQCAFAIRGIFENVQLPYPKALTLIWDKRVLPAYGWIFPLSQGRANVGIGLRTDLLRRSSHNLPSLFEQFLQLPRVKEALQGARLEGRALGHGLPMSAQWLPCAFDRVLLAGDAAGFVNPLTGEGIEYALESGELAGKYAALALTEGRVGQEPLLAYEQACQARFGSVLGLNGYLRLVFSVPWLLDRVFQAAKRTDSIREQLAHIALGGDQAKLSARLVLGAVAGR